MLFQISNSCSNVSTAAIQAYPYRSILATSSASLCVHSMLHRQARNRLMKTNSIYGITRSRVSRRQFGDRGLSWERLLRSTESSSIVLFQEHFKHHFEKKLKKHQQKYGQLSTAATRACTSALPQHVRSDTTAFSEYIIPFSIVSASFFFYLLEFSEKMAFQEAGRILRAVYLHLVKKEIQFRRNMHGDRDMNQKCSIFNMHDSANI